jgi:hypothetical protein
VALRTYPRYIGKILHNTVLTLPRRSLIDSVFVSRAVRLLLIFPTLLDNPIDKSQTQSCFSVKYRQLFGTSSSRRRLQVSLLDQVTGGYWVRDPG